MADYTLTLHEYLSYYGADSLFDFNYPIFDEGYRTTFEQMIVDEYLYREICILPPERWKHMFRTRLLKHINYINQLYRSTLFKYNPLVNVCIEESRDRHDNMRQMTDFGSMLHAHEKERRNQAYMEDLLETGDLHKGTDFDQTDHNDTGTDYTSKENEDTIHEKTTDFTGKEVEDNKHTKETDHTENVKEQNSSTTDTDTDVHITKGETQITDTVGNVDKVGESHTKTNAVADTTSTATKTRSDYPQANLSATPPENPGQWATWQEHDIGTSKTTTNSTEDINTKENTDSTENIQRETDYDETQIKTEAERFAESKNKDTIDNTLENFIEGKDKDTKEDTIENFSENREQRTTDRTDREYDGTVNSREDVQQNTIDTANKRGNENALKKASRESQLATAETRKRKLDQNTLNILSGHRDISISKLVQEYRDVLLNVDNVVVGYFENLFMGVW